MDLNVLIGGKAGAGIKEAGRMLAGVLANLGYHVFGYVDYPSLIRGGHNFVVLRFSERKVRSTDKRADVIVATDRRSVEAHLKDEKEGTLWIVDERIDKEGALKAPFKEVAPGFFKSSSVLGVLLKVLGIPVEEGLPFIEQLPQRKKNLSIYREAYSSVPAKFEVERIGEISGAVVTGNECVALGAVDGGLEFYVAYPMTPASPVLHYLAAKQDELGVKVVHPENEIAVVSMAVGIAYAGRRVMVGTSGGGFALMTETLSLMGMSETPVVLYEAQRAGPSTGVPTYTAQSDLLFVLFAGHGDFPRVVLAPGYPEEAYELTRYALNVAWKFQVPVIVLGDKHLGESYFTVRLRRERVVEEPRLWTGEGEFRRYQITEDGVSPLAFPGRRGAVVKATSYEHDERGITVEDADSVRRMQEKRLRKWKTLEEELTAAESSVSVSGREDADTVVLTYGSTAGAVEDVAEEVGYRVVRPLLLEPFPRQKVLEHIAGAQRLVVVEGTASGQFEKLLNMHGIRVHDRVRKFDGRPFFREELKDLLRGVVHG